MKTARWPIVLAGVMLIAAGCFAEAPDPNTANTTNELQLLTDPHFVNGFNLLGIRSIETGSKVHDVLNYGKSSDVRPAWRLAQWGTSHSLQGAKVEIVRPGMFRYSNVAKSVTADTVHGELTLSALGSREYKAPRTANQEWPHLLVEQYLEHQPLVRDLGELRMKLRVRVTQFRDHMTSESTNPALHAAQLQIYLMLQNTDRASRSYGDYLWFGLALFDNREEMPKETYHRDGGKEDTTHKFIYIMPSSAFLTKSTRDGEWASINVDVRPYVEKAVGIAHAEGFLQGTPQDKLAVTSLNLGWELPGTFDVEATIRELELLAIRHPGASVQAGTP
ncbi:MAG: hypothetical protein ACR2IE_07795 [Candidatus Sumerlaeaceae bacterium]